MISRSFAIVLASLSAAHSTADQILGCELSLNAPVEVRLLHHGASGPRGPAERLGALPFGDPVMLILQDASKSRSTLAPDWSPKGLCEAR